MEFSEFRAAARDILIDNGFWRGMHVDHIVSLHFLLRGGFLDGSYGFHGSEMVICH